MGQEMSCYRAAQVKAAYGSRQAASAPVAAARGAKARVPVLRKARGKSVCVLKKGAARACVRSRSSGKGKAKARASSSMSLRTGWVAHECLFTGVYTVLVQSMKKQS